VTKICQHGPGAVLSEIVTTGSLRTVPGLSQLLQLLSRLSRKILLRPCHSTHTSG